MQDKLLLIFIDINWALENTAWHSCENKSLVIAQICLYTTHISSSISPPFSNPFMSEIVLTSVTGEIASRFTEKHLQRFFLFFILFVFFSGDDNINRVLSLVAGVRVTPNTLERIIFFSIQYLSLNQTRSLTDTHILTHMHAGP